MHARMPDDRLRPIDSTDAPLDSTLARAVDVLRGEVPVRAEWRRDVIAGATRATGTPRRRQLAMSWPTAAAAGAALLAAGAALSRAIDHSPVAPPARTVAPATTMHAGTRFVFVAPNAKRVALVGDFNLWDPARAPMHRIAGSDAWEVDVTLPPGRHAYAFVVDGDVTADPSAPRTAGDDFGRPSSVVLVSSNRS
jgi:hypothetical protein